MERRYLKSIRSISNENSADKIHEFYLVQYAVR